MRITSHSSHEYKYLANTACVNVNKNGICVYIRIDFGELYWIYYIIRKHNNEKIHFSLVNSRICCKFAANKAIRHKII